MSEVIFYVLIIIVIPWSFILFVRDYWSNRKRRKATEKRWREYSINPSLRHEDEIRSAKVKFIVYKNFRQGPLYASTFNLSYSTPVIDVATKIKKNIFDDGKLTEDDRKNLMNYLHESLGAKINEELEGKRLYEKNKLERLEQQKLREITEKNRNKRRRLVIDRLTGEHSYVQLGKDSYLVKNFNKPFVFKSNFWENIDGSYVLSAGDSYDEGVVNLHKNLFKLRRSNQIKRIDPLSDPRTV